MWMWQSAAFAGAFSCGGSVPAEFGTWVPCAMCRSGGNARDRHADERVAREDLGELVFAPVLGASRTHRDHDVTHVGVRIVHSHADAVGKLGAELFQHGARLENDARAVVAALVPRRRHAE